jgi:CysZ protein
MVSAALKALGDLLSPEFRAIFWTAIGLTLGLFVAVGVGVMALFWFMTLLPWPWLETVVAIGTGLGLVVLFFFLMAPVTSMFAGLFLDRIAAKVEAKHYPRDEPGRPLSGVQTILIPLQFFVIVLLANILALPLVFTGFGVLILFVINAYLISREYFEMVAMRHMEPADAKALRKAQAAEIFVSGFVPAVLAIIPFINLVVPLFSTSYFTHIFKQVRVSSA